MPFWGRWWPEVGVTGHEVWGRGSDLGIVSVQVVLEAWGSERQEGGEVMVPDGKKRQGQQDVKQLSPVSTALACLTLSLRWVSWGLDTAHCLLGGSASIC